MLGAPGFPASPSRALAALVFAGVLVGCGSPQPIAAPDGKDNAPLGFEVVAEGPCGRLAVQGFEGRVLLVYGETGFDLHDWAPSERLAAAQSFVQLKDGSAYRTPSLYRGLPLNAGGYFMADLAMGESPEEGPWLYAVETRYAARSEGRLFDRRGRAYTRKSGTWIPSSNEGPVPFPGVARSLPPLPLPTACGKPGLRLVPLASSRLASGALLVAGRCQDESHVNYPETSVLVLRGLPGATSWKVDTAPDATALDGIVNLGVHAQSANDAYLVAWEPFKPPEARKPYLAHFDGTRWEAEDANLPEGLMSAASTPDGTLYVAAGRALYKRPRRGMPFETVALPPLRFADDPRPPTLRIHTVRTGIGSPSDVWVEGTYRVSLPGTKERVEARASVLYRLTAPGSSARGPVLFCDAREPADRALSAVDSSSEKR